MKKKDLVFLVIAVCILLVAGYLVYTQLVPKKAGAAASNTVTVETVGQIPSSVDSSGLTQMTSSTMQDYNSPVDFTGLNNTEPFGQ